MPSKEGIDLAGELLEQIKKLGPDDVDFVLTVLNASFPKEKSSSSGKKTQSFPKGNSPSSNSGVAQRSQGRGGRGRGAPAGRGGGGYDLNLSAASSEGGGGGCNLIASAAPFAVGDLLPSVIQRLTPLTSALPEVSRDPSADAPKSDRKSVQKRLNGKRAELQHTLEKYESADDDYYGFECLNKVQAFLLAAIDASTTDGVRLRTDPLPADFATMVDGLKTIALERVDSKEVTDYGFFSNSDHHYAPPEGGDTDN